ncbi:MAG: hypothetical protein ACK4KW_00295 [Gemmobacter sp.]
MDPELVILYGWGHVLPVIVFAALENPPAGDATGRAFASAAGAAGLLGLTSHQRGRLGALVAAGLLGGAVVPAVAARSLRAHLPRSSALAWPALRAGLYLGLVAVPFAAARFIPL